MSEQPVDSGSEQAHEHHVIREDNWPEYEARGFFHLARGTYEEAQASLGAANVYIGDAWDDEAGRPLRHKPGTSFYSNDDGVDYAFELWQGSKAEVEAGWRRRSQERTHQEPPSSGPASS
jgi:hypothetical protein